MEDDGDEKDALCYQQKASVPSSPKDALPSKNIVSFREARVNLNTQEEAETDYKYFMKSTKNT